MDSEESEPGVLPLCPCHWVGHGANGCHQWVISPFFPSVPQCGAQDLKYYVWLMLAPLTEESQPSFSAEFEGQVFSLSGSVLGQSFSVCSESPVPDFEVPHLTLYCRNIFIEWWCGPFKSQFELLLGFERF